MTTLEKIRAEIEKLRPNLRPEQMTDYDYAMADVFNDIMQIIDKYAEQEPCSDSVSRQAVLDIVCGAYEKDGWGESNFYKAIKQLPSVRPQEQTGEWIALENRFELGDRLKCSECGQVFVVGDDVSRNYCPNCGARMERGDKG